MTLNEIFQLSYFTYNKVSFAIVSQAILKKTSQCGVPVRDMSLFTSRQRVDDVAKTQNGVCLSYVTQTVLEGTI